MPSMNSYSITLTLNKAYSEKLKESFKTLKDSFPSITLLDSRDYHVTIGLSRDEFFNKAKQEMLTYEIQKTILLQDFSSFTDVFADQLFIMKNPNNYYSFSYLVLKLKQVASLKLNIINNLNQEIVRVFQANNLEVANFSCVENYIAHLSIGKIANNLKLDPNILENFLRTLKEKNLIRLKFFALEVNFTDEHLNQHCLLKIELEPLIYHDQIKTYQSQFDHYHQNSIQIVPYPQYPQVQLYPYYSHILLYDQKYSQAPPLSFRHSPMPWLKPESNFLDNKKFNMKYLPVNQSGYALSKSNNEDIQSNSELLKFTPREKRVLQDLILMGVLSTQEELSTKQQQLLSKILHYFIKQHYETTTQTHLPIQKMQGFFHTKPEYLSMLIDVIPQIEYLYSNHHKEIVYIISIVFKIYAKTKNFQQDFIIQEKNSCLMFTTKENKHDKNLYLQNLTELNLLLHNLISKQAVITLQNLSKEIIDFFNSDQNKNQRLRNFTISKLKIKTEEKNGEVKFILVPFGDLVKHLRKVGYVLSEVLDKSDMQKNYLISFAENFSTANTNSNTTNKKNIPPKKKTQKNK